MTYHGSHAVPSCRLCGGSLVLSLSLEPTPPANEFVLTSSKDSLQDEFPLDIMTCEGCGHVQLGHVVDPERLFRNYVYVSGTSPVFVDHFSRYAESMISRYRLKRGDLVVDVGSNDGTLLSFFKNAGMRVLGVDPAVSIARAASARGIPTEPHFFSPDLVDRLVLEHGQAHLVVANNVMAHAEGLRTIVQAVFKMMRSDGAFAFEVSYLPDVINGGLFDTVYHEHLSYHHVDPLVPFFESEDMRLIDVERINTHGGSIRCHVKRRTARPALDTVSDLRIGERSMGLHCPALGPSSFNPAVWSRFGESIRRAGSALTSRLRDMKASGMSIAGYGAPAKATTLMYQFGLGPEDLDFIVDDSPLKAGLFTPGKHIPVLPSSAIRDRMPDAVVILAWNFADSIVQKLGWYRELGGKIITPLPDFRET
jgi:SAM-dependent methyltransferase